MSDIVTAPSYWWAQYGVDSLFLVLNIYSFAYLQHDANIRKAIYISHSYIHQHLYTFQSYFCIRRPVTLILHGFAGAWGILPLVPARVLRAFFVSRLWVSL